MNQSEQQMTPLTEKDLSYMKDMMAWELLVAKKAYQYSCQSLDPQCSSVMTQVANQHQSNYQQVMQHLGHHMKQTVQASVTGAQPLTTHM